jgi:UDP-N-acetylglucosamine 3-dehydrogenase
MNVGIAGAGFMGETHAKSYEKLPGVKLCALAESNSEKRHYFSNLFSPAKVYDDVFKMIDDDDIDMIDICLPTPLHTQIAVAALKKNKHVLLEKPITLNLDDAEMIRKAAIESNGKFMVAHVLRFWPEYVAIQKALKEHMRSQDIVEIYASRFNELPLWSENTWMMNEEKSGGLIVDLMIHDIDFIIWNLGKVNRVLTHGIYNNKNFAIHATAILEMESGTVAYVEGGYLNPSGSGLSTQMRVYGKNSLLEMYPYNNTIKLSQKDKVFKEIHVSGNDGYYEEIKYFINCIKQNVTPEIVTIDSAIDSLKTCLALKRSLNEKKWITIKNK